MFLFEWMLYLDHYILQPILVFFFIVHSISIVHLKWNVSQSISIVILIQQEFSVSSIRFSFENGKQSYMSRIYVTTAKQNKKKRIKRTWKRGDAIKQQNHVRVLRSKCSTQNVITRYNLIWYSNSIQHEAIEDEICAKKKSADAE